MSNSFLSFRDKVVAKMKADIVVDVANKILDRPFREAKPAPRRVDDEWLKRVVEWTPSVHVAWIGSAQQIAYNHLGQMVGPWALVAHVVAEAKGVREAEEIMLDRLHTLANYINGQTWGYATASPAVVTDIENLWDIQGTDRGYAIGSIMWHQEAAFGENLLDKAERELGAFEHQGPDYAIEFPPIDPTPTEIVVDDPS